jgi:hypothetical protein
LADELRKPRMSRHVQFDGDPLINLQNTHLYEKLRTHKDELDVRLRRSVESRTAHEENPRTIAHPKKVYSMP